jgi:type VI secretion system secreted protein VgrG
MGIRARVGRHTQHAGKQCQNWGDDQKAIIDLLNQIPASNGGTGGSLKPPRIVPGIASNELYNAIVAFENKHFPGHRSGFVDPGGQMYKKLEALAATPAAVVVPAAPAAPTEPAVDYNPPDVSTDDRMLKRGEIELLRPIFRDTFPYDDQQIGANTREWGGHTNSITPNYLPKLAMSIWRFDFSTADNTDKGIFVHEMTHAWQWYHGRNNILSAAKLAIRYGSDYEQAYFYNFDDSDNFFDFNFEQQASIVEDYWFVTKNLVPRSNKGMRANRATYEQYMAQVWGAGPPHRQPYRDRSKDWKMQRHTP